VLDRPDVSLGIRRTAAGVVLVDRSCGRCASCTAGATLWCGQPEDEGRDLALAVPADRAETLGAALAAAAAFVEAPAASTVLVVDEEDGPLAVLVQALSSARVLVGPDPFDAALKAQLADVEPTGRAAVIVAGSDARAAVKAVRRGGHVCVGDPAARMPSVTELVQREVTLVGPRAVAGLIRRVGDPVWTATVAAAA
jgi:threonine dehydrogenase-like Zn-dependent dehydrogenase